MPHTNDNTKSMEENLSKFREENQVGVILQYSPTKYSLAFNSNGCDITPL